MSFKTLNNQFQGTRINEQLSVSSSQEDSDQELQQSKYYSPETYPDIEVEQPVLSQSDERSEINRKILTMPDNEIASTGSQSYQTLTHSSETSDEDTAVEAEFKSDIESPLATLVKPEPKVTSATKNENNLFKIRNNNMSAGELSQPVVRKRLSQQTGQIEKLRILTYNLWFHESNRLERAQQIIHLIKKQQIEIVGLQEVVPETFELIVKHLKTDYLVFQVFIDEKLPYGDCLLFRRERIHIVEPYFYDYPKTAMSRKLIGCEIQVKGFQPKLHILTTHLESGRNNAEVRHHQFQIIEEVVNKQNIGNVIMMGDLNITNIKEPTEDQIQQSVFSDAWIEIGCPEDLKYTYDYLRNSRITSKFRSRLDRILYRLGFEHLISGLKLVGITQELPPPSDHFGLLAEFIFKSG